MSNAERVIFRREKNSYVQSIRCANTKSLTPYEETLCNPEYNYLALFPDDPAQPGRVECVPFFFDNHGTAFFEPCSEADIGYIHRKTRIIHKKDPVAETLLKAISNYYGMPFRIAEKMTH